MHASVLKMTWRSIRSFFGRYMALLLIVALSAGFFAGLKVTKDAMGNTCEKFLDQQNFYDFRLYSTLGFTEEDVEAFADLSAVEAAEGTWTVDAMMRHDGSDRPYKVFALPEQVNLPALAAGRMPEAENECLVDDEVFDESDIGTVIAVSKENDETVTDQLEGTEYTIVGLANSPLYLDGDRGTTGIGSGALHGYLYVPAENFTSEIYTEIALTLEETAPIYSKDYDELIEQHEDTVTELLEQLAEERYDDILEENGLTPEAAELFGMTVTELAEQNGIEEAETFVLTRDENDGYLSFESDTSIVSGIANIFPVFFILIAMLVCITTMTRMVDEERTQIGVLKAMGFSDSAITAKYLLYAGSATCLGWLIGFFVCTWGLPQIFWFAYSAIYDFAPMDYVFSADMAVVTLAVSLVGILGSTYISCRTELGSAPAKLIRPRAAKNGKRILLERITPLWKRLSFLQKITMRNMFRYKRRLIMMLVGISCCAGLVVTAFGVRDSMINIGALQFTEVQTYGMEASFEEGDAEQVEAELEKLEGVTDYLTCCVYRVDVHGSETVNSVSLMSFADFDEVSGFWNFRNGEETVAKPGRGEAIVNTKIADKLELSVGDTVEIQDADLHTCEVTVSGIFDGYINNFIILSDETYEDCFGEWEANTALLVTETDSEELAEKVTGIEEITSVSRLSTTRDSIDGALSCLNYIIWLIVLFSGALAFIVIFNLTNINLAERSREIATVQVLGFYPKETESYVLRENLMLSVLASFIGLPLGTLFHRIVMSMIVIDTLSFDVHITPVSYVLSLICTILFALVVDLFMKRQINKIKMAESLKAVE